MSRSEITIDLGALRRNAAALVEAAGGAELWAVVKADAYGHGAADCARAALEGGARVLCVATAKEGAALRAEHERTERLFVHQERQDQERGHARRREPAREHHLP